MIKIIYKKINNEPQIRSVVKIRQDLIGGLRYGGVYFNPEMKKYRGKRATILKKNIKQNGFCLDIDCGFWNWNKVMLEPVK